MFLFAGAETLAIPPAYCNRVSGRRRRRIYLQSTGDSRSVSTTPCRVTPPLGARGPAPVASTIPPLSAWPCHMPVGTRGPKNFLMHPSKVSCAQCPSTKQLFCLCSPQAVLTRVSCTERTYRCDTAHPRMYGWARDVAEDPRRIAQQTAVELLRLCRT